MSRSKKKYLSDFAVNLFSARWLLTPAHQLMSGGTIIDSTEQEVADNSHIYIISKSPAISFSEKSFKYENGVVSGHINYHVEGHIKEKEFSFKFPLLDGAVGLKLSKYPYREFYTFDSKGKEVRYLPASIVSMQTGWHLENRELSDLEVLYIGQAFGDGNRSAFDRLKSHSTLQKILAKEQHDSPESEIQILTFQYAPYRVVSIMDGRAEGAIDDYRDIDRFKAIVNTPLSEYQQICLIEAGLIRYFRPHYNTIYKDNFPSNKHKILESCYDLDFSALVVEINTDELGFNLFSKDVMPRMHHISQIELVDPDERWGFFHYSRGDGSAFKIPNVIQKNANK